ncbi:RNA polymerase II C-terminal domain phosphatase-like 1 [Impatiens glandulifera]|uniref:RNA polymerase II C-terminal domain phosphatase-like 1 n=1 Tax=Impatiens glandulifera TaxID=253017 RepID=UPI001FB17861|nr:RNA polymerase II C-terminal domain phosphatase-like 1 [Impatiens glandulifera]
MYKSVVYHVDKLIGEVEVYPQNQIRNGIVVVGEQIRISHFSQPSERCSPLSVLHTIALSGVCFKMESKIHSPDSLLNLLHFSCFREKKTAVVSLGMEELHLVAMPSCRNEENYPCFWAFLTPSGLYNSCLVMLNLRCLGLVFDLDETLVVANTMRSFDDRIEALQRKKNTETSPLRIAAMLAEIKRYQDDKIILRQYAETDQILDNGKVIKSQPEVVPALSETYPSMVRPLIRLYDKNIILTRIHPLIRDTSVLVRLRPAWEELRTYLTAKGRKRFEVYVCTMAERDYALEMWRLLDPELNLINSRQLLDRVVCVKSGLKKSLFNVFKSGSCHPKMALVIDDRLKVWEEEDQPRVHVVPAFAPYVSPQAEENNEVPILCFARNVACNVRGGFFKEFDDSVLQRISEVMYEDDYKDIPASLDVSSFLVSEDDPSTLIANKDPNRINGIAGSEIVGRLKDAISDPRLTAFPNAFPPPPPPPSIPIQNKQLTQVTSVIRPLSQIGLPESSPAREEGEVPESELDPDTRRRLLILQHGKDWRDPSQSETLRTPPVPISQPQVQPRKSWFAMEEETNPRLMNRVGTQKEFPVNSEPVYRLPPPPPPPPPPPIPSDRFLENQRFPREAQREDRSRANYDHPGYDSFPGDEVPFRRSLSNRDLEENQGRNDLFDETPVGALQGIAYKCGAKVEFRPSLVSSLELQFSIEVLFAGEKIGEGIGKTRKEALFQAAEVSLMNLADQYLSSSNPDSSFVHAEGSKFPSGNNNSFVGNLNSYRHVDDSIMDPSRIMESRLDGSKKPMGSVSAHPREMFMDGFDAYYRAQPAAPSSGHLHRNNAYAQVEEGDQDSWDEALVMQPKEKANGSLKTPVGQFPHKRRSPRSFQRMPGKRFKQEYPRSSQQQQQQQRMSSNNRYTKNVP